MPRIKTIPLDNSVSKEDFVAGSDNENAGVTRNYKLGDILALFNSLSGGGLFSYVFTDLNDVNSTDGTMGSLSNELSSNLVTSFRFSSRDINESNLTTLIGNYNNNSDKVVIKLTEESSPNNIAVYTINYITTSLNYVDVSVTNYGNLNTAVFSNNSVYVLGFDYVYLGAGNGINNLTNVLSAGNEAAGQDIKGVGEFTSSLAAIGGGSVSPVRSLGVENRNSSELYSYGITNLNTRDTDTDTYSYGIYTKAAYGGSTNQSLLYGIDNRIEATGSADIDYFYATINRANLYGTGTMEHLAVNNALLDATLGSNINNAATYYSKIVDFNGTANKIDGVLIDLDNGTNGTITTLNGIHLRSWSNSGTITNSRGIFIDSTIDVGDTSHTILSLSKAPSEFAGTMRAEDYLGNEDITKTDIPENATVINSAASSGSYSVKAGRLIVSNTLFVTNAGQSGFKTIATLPEGARPDTDRQIRAYELSSGLAVDMILILVGTDGALKTTVKSGASYYFDFECTLTQP